MNDQQQSLTKLANIETLVSLIQSHQEPLPLSLQDHIDLVYVITLLAGGQSIPRVTRLLARVMQRYPLALRDMYDLLNPAKPRPPVVVEYHWCKTSPTKESYNAGQFYPEAYYYQDNKDGRFEGYAGQEVVVMDEFQGLMAPDIFHRLLSERECRMPIHRSSVVIKAFKFVIVTTVPPDNLYRGFPEIQLKLETLLFRHGFRNDQHVRG
jgi:hypothetical protein